MPLPRLITRSGDSGHLVDSPPPGGAVERARGDAGTEAPDEVELGLPQGEGELRLDPEQPGQLCLLHQLAQRPRTRQLRLEPLLARLPDPDQEPGGERDLELAGEALAGELEVGAAGDRAVAALAHLEWLGIATAHARALQEGLDPEALPVPGEVEARLTREADNRS